VCYLNDLEIINKGFLKKSKLKPHMKTLARFASALTLLTLSIVAINFMGCGPDPGPDPVEPEPTLKEQRTTLLKAGGASWTPSSSGIKVDGVDVTADLFDGFTIKFEGSTLTTTGTTPVWERTDTWSFKDDNANVIIRGSDGKEVTISSISASELKLTLEWDQYTYEEGGRQKSIPGTYEFTLNK
jgi:hypothetical protein